MHCVCGSVLETHEDEAKHSWCDWDEEEVANELVPLDLSDVASSIESFLEDAHAKLLCALALQCDSAEASAHLCNAIDELETARGLLSETKAR
jgi:hypothetical protein